MHNALLIFSDMSQINSLVEWMGLDDSHGAASSALPADDSSGHGAARTSLTRRIGGALQSSECLVVLRESELKGEPYRWRCVCEFSVCSKSLCLTLGNRSQEQAWRGQGIPNQEDSRSITIK